MRMMMIAALAATALAAPVTAQRGPGNDWHNDQNSYRNYDYNRPPPGQHDYDPKQFYRDGGNYQPRRLTRNDRVYRGSDGRSYCRRNDGTTGLVVGAAGGALLGSALAGRGSGLLGAVLGGAGGGLIGRAVDRGQVTCR